MTTDNSVFINNLSAKIYDVKSVLEEKKKEQKRKKSKITKKTEKKR